MSITMIGLDTAKAVFQVHAVDGAGLVVTRRKLRRNELIAFFEKQAAWHGRHGGVRRGASLGPRVDRSWARGEADRTRGGPVVREEGQEERRGRRGRDLRGRIPAGGEVRAD